MVKALALILLALLISGIGSAAATNSKNYASSAATSGFEDAEGSSDFKAIPAAISVPEERHMAAIGSDYDAARAHDISAASETQTPSPGAGAVKRALSEYRASSSMSVVPEDTFAIVANENTNTVPPNWVSRTIGDITDTACYRKKHRVNSSGGCSQGYSPNAKTCWAQCPIAYPVQCFAECIPQNDDCALEVLTKVTNVGFVAFNAATLGVFNAIYKTYKTLKKGVICAMNLFNIAEGITRYLRFRQTMATNGTKEELLAMLYQTDMFLVDLPVAVTACLGYKVPKAARYADMVVTTVETIIKQLIINRELIMSSAQSFLRFLGSTALSNVTTNLDAESVENITSLIDSGSTCGYQLKKLTDRVVDMVNDIRDDNSEATNEDIRTIMSLSPLATNDVPTVTNNCLGELLATKTEKVAYETRDVLRKTFGVIIDQLIETSTTDMGKAMLKEDYMLTIANMGLLGLSAIDPFGIAFMTYHFVQPICGPTEFLGEIDDGSLTDALGLKTMDDAFNGSYGTWSKHGDGVVSITFVSTDKKDVTVVIHSGGKKFDKVRVDAGKTVKWTSTVKKLQEKALYLDRWRPGFFGLSGSGGGSLRMWIPRAAAGGHLEMTVKINIS